MRVRAAAWYRPLATEVDDVGAVWLLVAIGGIERGLAPADGSGGEVLGAVECGRRSRAGDRRRNLLQLSITHARRRTLDLFDGRACSPEEEEEGSGTAAARGGGVYHVHVLMEDGAASARADDQSAVEERAEHRTKREGGCRLARAQIK